MTARSMRTSNHAQLFSFLSSWLGAIKTSFMAFYILLSFLQRIPIGQKPVEGGLGALRSDLDTGCLERSVGLLEEVGFDHQDGLRGVGVVAISWGALGQLSPLPMDMMELA